MEPQIKYARTEDGVSVAYWTLGEGKPFILPPGSMVGGSLRAWRTPDGRALLERLAMHRMLVRYDARGFGYSQAGTADFSLEARIRDVAAVVAALGSGPVDLCGYVDSAPGIIAYTAAHPSEVSHLVLWAPSVREAARLASDEALDLLAKLAEVDFELYTAAMTAAYVRWTAIGPNAEYTQSIREAITPDAADSLLRLQTIDVTDLLSDIRAPTLILHRRGIKEPPIEQVEAIAARIPNARLVMLEGDSAIPYTGDRELLANVIDEFLGVGAAPVPATGGPRVATLLFTDLVDHTEMMRRLGDAAGRELLREHERITRDAIREHGGTEIKTDGDSFMVPFGSVASAMQCAVELQRAFAQRGETAAEPLRVRMGLNAGEPIEDEGDLFGETVILASRIAAHAGPGEILIPETVRHLLAGKGFLFADRGEFVPKGFEDAVRRYEVRWRE